jgi:hypothetical protein
VNTWPFAPRRSVIERTVTRRRHRKLIDLVAWTRTIAEIAPHNREGRRPCGSMSGTCPHPRVEKPRADSRSTRSTAQLHHFSAGR